MLYKIILSIVIVARNLNVIASLIKEDTFYNGSEADRFDWTNHPCKRPCLDGGAPMICEYLFVIETYMSMTKACYDCPRNLTDCYRPHCVPTDGDHKFIYVTNRRLPGPYIEVCEGDTIVVDVRNKMQASTTTIHWHGIMQKESPYMDGVPFVTQCPILPGSTFRYQILASQSGTYFWHSHIGGQRADGLFGAITIRQSPSKNPHKDLYDFDEHSITVIDWKKYHGEEFFVRGNQVSARLTIHTMLINGRGRFHNFAKKGEQPVYTPDAVFKVKQGYKYRFRLTNAGAENCPIQVSVDNHILTVISTDSNDIEPVQVDTIYTWPGERYDFIVNANKKIDNYWIRFRGYGNLCNNMTNLSKNNQVAILRYEGAPIEDPKNPYGWNVYGLPDNPVELNPYNTSKISDKAVRITSLKALVPNDVSTRKEADEQIYVSVNLNAIDNYDYHRAGLYGFREMYKSNINATLFTLQFDHISFEMPNIALLSQRHMITPNMLCNTTTMADKDCEHKHCACPYTLHVKLNSLVEFIVVDESIRDSANHPMHLHGHFFRVVAEGTLDGKVTIDRVKQLDREGKIKRNFDHPPLKDTLRVPRNGYTIIRFYADNPGYWFYHCHFEQHTELGLALIFKVGENKDMLPVPQNFPQCGNYQPKIM